MIKRCIFGLFQILVLVFGFFSFGYLLSEEVGFVSGEEDALIDGETEGFNTGKDKISTNKNAGKGFGKVGLGAASSINSPATPEVAAWWSGAKTIEAGKALPPGVYEGGGSILGTESAFEAGSVDKVIIQKTKDGYSLKAYGFDGEVLGTDNSAVAYTAGENGVATAGGASHSTLSEYLGAGGGSVGDSLVSGLQWAVIAYFAGTMIGDLFGFSDKNSEALGTSLAAGFGTFKALDTYSKFDSATGQWLHANANWVGIGVGVIVFVAMYKDEKSSTVTFDCLPWQAPNGGNDCEVCNDDTLPCSEYRCRSLGQSCELVNEGTEEEKCVYVNPKDVDPPVIRPNYEDLTTGHNYKNVRNSPPGPGFEIVNLGSNDGCLEAFTPIEFGIVTDEPSQCKIDFNHTESYEDMAAYFGGVNLYLYNHTDRISLPGASELQGSGFSLKNGKDMSFFIRCQDKSGNTNEAEYAMEFCVDPSPDTTPPRIDATSIANGGCVAEDVDSAQVIFYVNEPSSCKWSFIDQDYDLMEYEMSCTSGATQINAAQLFGCSATLSGIPRDGVNYYIRCKDQPGKAENDRNENSESFEFSLRGSTGLKMLNLRPNGTIFGGVSPAPVELYVETLFGCNNGRAVCQWSNDGKNYIEFFDTNKEDGIHTQRLDLTDGEHEINVRCVDAGGNLVEDVAEFEVDIDTNAPAVARVYEEGGMLKVVTVRDSECSYSLDNCDFSFGEGTEMPYGNTTVHVAEWNDDQTYYVKCRDEFLNEQADCSVVVRPTQNFL